MRVLVTGATGLIGRRLIHRLLVEGHEVHALARTPEKLTELSATNVYDWSDDRVPEKETLKNYEAIVHLAGEGIVDKRWSRVRKQRLWNSRTEGTQNLIAGIGLLEPADRPKVLISGSAIGYYGSSLVEKDEDSDAGTGFLAGLCREWENQATKAEVLGVRTVILRTGLVLAKAHEGGLLAKAAPVVFGDGRQWMSWIHVEDMVRFILYALGNQDLKGPYNLTAPNPVTNNVFTEAIAKATGFPFTVGVPAIVLKMLLGEMSVAILGSQNVKPKKTLGSGFSFRFVELQDALADLLGNESVLDSHFTVRQFVPLKPKEIFPFFSQAENLEVLTPPWLNFRITKKTDSEVRRGSLIEYKLKIHGVPVTWKTLIRDWNPNSSFVDEQLKGPYTKWHHLHDFEAFAGGTLISDDVTYRVPGWLVGKLLLLPFIRRDVGNIFRYRTEKIKEMFDPNYLS